MDLRKGCYPPQKMGGYGKICVCFFFGLPIFFKGRTFLGLSEIDLLHESAYFFLDSCVKFLKGGTCSFRIYIYIYIHLFLQAHMCIYIYTIYICLY